MDDPSTFPELDHLIETYFNQDFDLWGDTIPEIVASYREGTTPERLDALGVEVERLIEQHPNDLDNAFSGRYGFDFAPEPWGHTTLSFLRLVQQLLADA